MNATMQTLSKSVSVAMLLGAIVTSAHADDNVLAMGYPERDKIPMIADVPSHEGIFKDLYTAAAARLGMSVPAVTSAIHRMRGRFRALLFEEVANTVEKPEEVEQELRHLLAALSD